MPAVATEEERLLYPDDQLNDREAGAVLGVDVTTVRSYALTGYLPPGSRTRGAGGPAR